MTHHPRSTPTLKGASRPTARRRETKVHIQVECLEVRSLLTSTSATIVVSSEAADFTKEVTALQSEFTGLSFPFSSKGPLADLANGKINGDVFLEDVASMVMSWESQAAKDYKQSDPSVIKLLDLQGTALIDTENQWNERRNVGLYDAPKPPSPARTTMSKTRRRLSGN